MLIGPRNPISQQLHASKYRQRGESFDDYCVRYARTTADDEKHFRRLLERLRDQAILPAGRQQRAVGWPFQTTAFNCFVGGTIADDTRAIGDSLTNAMMTLRSGGGCGWDFSTLRGEGEPIRRLGDDAYASGPVSFMGIWNAMCNTIRSAGERRGAMMGVLRVDHPDILTFVRAKQDQKSLTNFNISVGITSEFMEAVETDSLFWLRFPAITPLSPPGTESRKIRQVRALDLWSIIMENNWDWAEPGILFLDTINRMNPLGYCEWIAATNPCFTGDTQVHTAYGPKTFRELAASGESIPVLTQLDDGRLVYREMVNPRRTRKNAPLVRIQLRGSGRKRGSITEVRCTPDHVFFLRDGRKVKARDLQQGDRIASAYRGRANQKGYIVIRGLAHSTMEHHLAAEYQYGRWPDADEDVHHLNEVKDDNRPENVEIIGITEHRQLHMRGDRNPLRRFPDKNPMVLDPECLAGEKNGRWRGELNEDQMAHLRAEGLSFHAIARECGCSSYTVQKRLRDRRERRAAEATRRRGRRGEPDNHVVLSVEYLEEREDVYCGTVPATGRFFIYTGTNESVLVSNCGEQPLPPDGSCLLLSHNIPKYLVPSYSRLQRDHQLGNGLEKHYVYNPRATAVPSYHPPARCGYEIDYSRLRHDVNLSVRACDNVFERTVYPLPAQGREAFAKRRMGVGVTGVANALEICGYRYGTPEYIAEQSKLLEVLRDTAYRTSIEMAKTKGSFPLFDAPKWLASGFAETLPDDIRDGILRYGLRNGLLLSIAPTGTISITADNVSSGIEPPPVIESTRTVNFSEGPRNVELNDWAYEEFGVRGRTAMETSPAEHVDVLCAAQRYVDSAISKTINLRGAKPGAEPTGDEISFAQFRDVYRQAYRGGAKGCAAYNANGKRAGIIVDRKPAGSQVPGNGTATGGGSQVTNGELAGGGDTAMGETLCEIDPTTGARNCG